MGPTNWSEELEEITGFGQRKNYRRDTGVK